jgi:hypothetical protein
MTPAETVFAELGIRPLARDLKLDPKTVFRWSEGDGLVPSKYHVKLLKLAKKRGRILTTDDLVMGRTVR